jgi:hypothetical protein
MDAGAFGTDLCISLALNGTGRLTLRRWPVGDGPWKPIGFQQSTPIGFQMASAWVRLRRRVGVPLSRARNRLTSLRHGTRYGQEEQLGPCKPKVIARPEAQTGWPGH